MTSIPATSITHMVQGSFTAPRQQELITATATSLELHRLHSKHPEPVLIPLFRSQLFAQVRCLSSFRLPATRQDYLILTSDAGTLTILIPHLPSQTFRRVHCEPFGRTGCRRIIPAQYLACDPNGRACMVAAVESQTFSYVLNRDAQQNLTISSPIEAHRPSVLTFSLIALDVGFENPVFAALERSYATDAQKCLAYYELDLGLNHVVRKLSAPVRTSSFLMLPVPGGDDGPGGLLVCSHGYVTYRNLTSEEASSATAREGADKEGAVIEAKLPFRANMSPDDTMVVSGTVYHHKKGHAFFFLLCTEFGDLIKAELAWQSDIGATRLRLVYFDSLPGPAIDVCIFRSGFLAVAVEGGDSLLLHFKKVDVPDDHPAGGLSVSDAAQDVRTPISMDVDMSPIATDAPSPPEPESHVGKVSFVKKDNMSFLEVSGVLESLAPLLSMCCVDEGVHGESLLCATGRGQPAGLRRLQRGVSVVEMSSAHTLPARMKDVFAFADSVDASVHRFIVVSFAQRTKVLVVGDVSVTESFESGFHLLDATLCAGVMDRNCLVQAYAHGIRYVPGGRGADATEWKPGVGTRIVCACCNNAQVVAVLSTGEVVYFEVDGENKALLQMEKFSALVSNDATNEVTASVAIAEIPPGRTRATMFAVGDNGSTKVRLYRVTDGTVEKLGLHIAPAHIHSVGLIDFGARETAKEKDTKYEALLTLVIGTVHGALVRVGVDAITGKMSGKRSAFLGPLAVRVRHVQMGKVATCVATGSRACMLHARGRGVVMAGLGIDGVESVAGFTSEVGGSGFVAISGRELRLLAVERLDALQAAASMSGLLPASYVPAGSALAAGFCVARNKARGTTRRVVPVVGGTGLFVVVEGDQRRRRVGEGVEMGGLGEWVSRLCLVEMGDGRVDEKNLEGDGKKGEDGEDEEEDFDALNALYEEGDTAVRFLDTVETQDGNDWIICAASTNCFGGIVDADVLSYIIVSRGRNGQMCGTSHIPRRRGEKAPETTGVLSVYKIMKTVKKLEFVHETPINEAAYAIAAMRDMVVVGAGRSVRLYDLGKRQLLRKAEAGLAVRNRVCALAVGGGDRVFVGDVQMSVTLLRLVRGGGGGREGGRFVEVAYDCVGRWVVSLICLDYSTVAGCDKFGNVFVLRLGAEAGDVNEGAVGGGKALLSVEACVHVGATVTCLAASRGGLVYGSVEGGIGVLAPFQGSADWEFAKGVENHVRKAWVSPCGRQHIAFRSAFYPVKNVVDGDLCDLFVALSDKEREACCQSVGRAEADVVRKLDELRDFVSPVFFG